MHLGFSHSHFLDLRDKMRFNLVQEIDEEVYLIGL